MNELERSASDYIGYEYKEKTVDSDKVSMYVDCYRCFGWVSDENISFDKQGRQTTIRLKRDRKIINQTELTRLQRHFEACINEVNELEKSRTSAASAWAIAVGVVGTIFMTGATFAVTHEPPLIWLCIVLAVPGFTGWTLPYFLYRRISQNRAKKTAPLIENKYEEIDGICEKGNQLLQH